MDTAAGRDIPRLKTPRGTFKIREIDQTAAAAQGFSIWFYHNGYIIVAGNDTAIAIPLDAYNREKEAAAETGG